MSARKAAVRVLFRQGRGGREVLLIRRSERVGDPWSGQMAFPGGHSDPQDADLKATALRELEEEVGLARHDLGVEPRFVGVHRPGNRLDMEVSVYVSDLREGEEPRPRIGPEVESTVWVPVGELETEHRRVALPAGRGQLEVEGFAWGAVFIWGLTYRILTALLAEGPPRGT